MCGVSRGPLHIALTWRPSLTERLHLRCHWSPCQREKIAVVIKCIPEVIHGHFWPQRSDLVARSHPTTKRPGGGKSQAWQANPNGKYVITEHDTITNVLVHKSFCVLLLMSLNFYRKIVEVDSTNICMLLMHVLDGLLYFGSETHTCPFIPSSGD